MRVVINQVINDRFRRVVNRNWASSCYGLLIVDCTPWVPIWFLTSCLCPVRYWLSVLLYIDTVYDQGHSNDILITDRNSSCGKVIFSQACVKNCVHSGRGVSAPIHGEIHIPPQADTPLGRHPLLGRHRPPGQTSPGQTSPGRHPPGRRLLRRMLRILLECILVSLLKFISFTFSW